MAELIDLLDGAGINANNCNVLIVKNEDGTYAAEFNSAEASIWSAPYADENTLLHDIAALGIEDVDRLEDYP